MDERQSSAQRDPQATWGASDQARPTWGSAGAQGSGPPGPASGPPGQQQTEGLAIGALVCAIANLVFPFFVPAIVALVLAAQASTKIKRSGGILGGRGLVTAARIVAVIALVLNAIGGAFAAFFFVIGIQEARDTAEQAVGETNVFLVEPGDCLQGSTDGLVSSVQVVGCDQPHDSEVFVNLDLPDGPFPGEDGVSATAQEACLAEFESYVGVPYEESQYDVRFFNPNEDSWRKGDRSVTCMVAPLDGEPLVGSARDSQL